MSLQICHLNLIFHCGNAVIVVTTLKFSKLFNTFDAKIAFGLRGVMVICANINFYNEIICFLLRL